VKALGLDAELVAASLTDGFNQGLAQEVSSSGLGGLPDIQIAQLDIFDRMTAILRSPADYGLTDVTDACVTPNVAPYTCQRPDNYFFWDGIHPTKAVHALIAQRAADTLNSYVAP